MFGKAVGWGGVFTIFGYVLYQFGISDVIYVFPTIIGFVLITIATISFIYYLIVVSIYTIEKLRGGLLRSQSVPQNPKEYTFEYELEFHKKFRVEKDNGRALSEVAISIFILVIYGLVGNIMGLSSIVSGISNFFQGFDQTFGENMISVVNGFIPFDLQALIQSVGADGLVTGLIFAPAILAVFIFVRNLRYLNEKSEIKRLSDKFDSFYDYEYRNIDKELRDFAAVFGILSVHLIVGKLHNETKYFTRNIIIAILYTLWYFTVVLWILSV